MTRILFWNIQNFSLGTVSARNRISDATAASDRMAYIMDVFSPNVHPGRPPDIIIVAEVFARQLGNAKNGVVLPSDTSSAVGLFQLLNKMRSDMANTWCLIPPLLIGEEGKCESMAVFYNAASLLFTGPFIYAIDNDGLAKGMLDTQAARASLANYGANTWLTGLPNPGNAIPALQLTRTWYSVDGVTLINEWQGAGQWRFWNSHGGDIYFPNKGCRPPFCTRFWDAAGSRLINVYAIHTTPGTNGRSAAGGTSAIGGIPEVIQKPEPAGQVTVIVGDFNVDSFSHDRLTYSGNPYYSLVNAGYRMLLSPMDAGGKVNRARRPFCLTHLLPNRTREDEQDVYVATPYNANKNDGYNGPTDPRHNVYPRFGYMGSGSTSASVSDTGSIDNALVRYPPNVIGPNPEVTIVNTVVGKPYDKLNDDLPPGVGPELTGGYDQPTTLQQGDRIPQPRGVDPPAAADGEYFNDWGNFGKIRTTSDHLALVFDV